MNALFESREEAAYAAAKAVARVLRNLIASRGRAVFLVDCTTAPLEFLTFLVAETEIDWTQVIVFQAAEFVGETPDSIASCQHFLTEHLIARVPVITFHPMRGDAPNPRAAISNLSERLTRMLPDIAVLSTELFAELSSLDPPASGIAELKLGDRVTLAFSLTALSECSVFVLGSDASCGNREIAGEQTFIFTNQ